MPDKPITVGAFVRDLRWLLPLSVGTMLALWALDVKGMRDLGVLGATGLGIGFVFVLGPIVWLRFERFGAHGRAFWRFWLLAILWVFVSLGLLMAVAAAIGID